MKTVNRWTGVCVGLVVVCLRGSMNGAGPAAQQPASPPATSASPRVCGNNPFCTENPDFAVRISDFQALLQNADQIKRVTLRLAIRNKLGRPLTLGYVTGSGTATDDRGNRYTVLRELGVQGIGEIRGNEADRKFQLQPDEISEARLEFAWSGQNIFGLTFQIDLAIREIDTLQGNQLRLGREFAVHFTGVTDKARSTTSTTASPPASPPAAAPIATVSAATQASACTGRSFCQAAGPFAAEVVGMTPGVSSSGRTLQVRVRLRNLATVPVILAYLKGTAIATDNQGQRYTVRLDGDGAKGIGVVDGNVADTQFVLPGGASGTAAFAVSRGVASSDPVGTMFNFDVTVAQLESLPGGQNRTVREFSLGFRGLTAAAVSALPTTTDACAGKTRCYSEGPFIAEVSGLASSQQSNWRVLQPTVRFSNASSQPVILGFVVGSAVITDDNGNRYVMASSLNDGARGMGVVNQDKADPQFVLNPGASGNVTFTLRWAPSRGTTIGTAFSFDLLVAQLEVLPSQQVRTVREYAVSLPSLTASGPNILNKLLQGLPKQNLTGAPVLRPLSGRQR